tara:strand:+ start:625 stop:819 length:195 start_codon:yes stop_codon:yes gene_type:complete
MLKHEWIQSNEQENEETLSILKNRKSQVNKTNKKIIHYVSVTFTPFYIDLNNQKKLVQLKQYID